jgi:two-component system response regulator HydG
MVVTNTDGMLDIHDVPTAIRSVPPQPSATLDELLGRPLEEVERELIARTLESTGGNRETAARILGIGERTLYRKIEKYGLR